jgi:hypothetical protein
MKRRLLGPERDGRGAMSGPGAVAAERFSCEPPLEIAEPGSISAVRTGPLWRGASAFMAMPYAMSDRIG